MPYSFLRNQKFDREFSALYIYHHVDLCMNRHFLQWIIKQAYFTTYVSTGRAGSKLLTVPAGLKNFGQLTSLVGKYLVDNIGSLLKIRKNEQCKEFESIFCTCRKVSKISAKKWQLHSIHYNHLMKSKRIKEYSKRTMTNLN